MIVCYRMQTYLRTINKMKQTGIEKALSMFDGNQTKLATAIGGDVVRQNIAHWLKAGRVPADQAPDVEKATGIKCEELCPGVSWEVLRRKSRATA